MSAEQATETPFDAQHRCHWPGCDAHVPPRMWGCHNHWFLLPRWLRTAIWHAYRPGQEVDKKPGGAYLFAARQALAWARCYERLLSLYTAAEAKRWMTSPQPLLDGDVPEDRIRGARWDSVAKVIAAATDGTYV